MSVSKIVAAAASGVGGGGLDVEDVFSTYLYDGTGAAQTIANGIDLDGEGGAILTKRRDSSSGSGPWFNDTERGITKYISTSSTSAETDSSSSISAVTSSGYTLGTFGGWNNSAGNYASWTFRKAPKFFDVVTYTGTGSAQNISHSLGSVPGMILTCNTGSSANWGVYHRQLNNGTDRGHWRIQLNTTSAQVDQSTFWNDTAPTDSVFTVGNNAATNDTDNTYVAYVFAHNDGDGEFGPDGDADIIKCGSYTGNQNAVGPVIDLGFEPQWLLIKNASAARPWLIIDVMRGTVVGTTNAGADNYLEANSSAAEQVDYYLSINATGFQPRDTGGNINASGETYIYMAIRRGTKVPESATEVFAIDQQNSSAPYFTSSFPVDFALAKNSTGTQYWRAYSRLTQDRELYPNVTDQEGGEANADFDYMDGFYTGSLGSDYFSWMWKRAPGYFDVQAFTLGSASNREVKHNLAAVPEMIWWKERSDTSYWMFWHKDFTSSQYMSLHLSDAIATSTNIWGTSAPTSTGWYMKETAFGGSGNTCISYTFASLPGISKVGSYTGNGSTSGPTVDCGFSGSPRFVLIKRTANTGSWYLFDSVRGIVAGNESQLYLNSTAAEQTATDQIDPTSSGFQIVTNATGLNSNGETYIFYAIA